MDLQTALKTALDFESNVFETYEAAARESTDPLARKVFVTLAKEEQDHIAYLRSRLDEWQRTGHVQPLELKTVVPSARRIKATLDRLEAGIGAPALQTTEVEWLKKALAAERETSGFYRKMVSELPPEGQNLFARFVEIEEGHLAIVQAQIDSVTGSGCWFDVQEFDLEAG
ncbi:MAG: ferritin family protein [Candidatus Riflebacteria bacterium]|nr:ferritin family protein [Candidatus Riflebacteria bacterium]